MQFNEIKCIFVINLTKLTNRNREIFEQYTIKKNYMVLYKLKQNYRKTINL